MRTRKLTYEQKRQVILWFAEDKGAHEVAQLVNSTFGLEISRQSVHRYDPRRPGGASVPADLAELFRSAHADYLRLRDERIRAWLDESEARRYPARLS